MMKNYDLVEIKHNWKRPYITDHRCWTLIIGGSGSGKTKLNVIELNVTSMTNFDKICFIDQRFIQIKVSIACLLKRMYSDLTWKKSKGIYWLFTNDWRCLWKFRRLWPNKAKKTVNSVWWHDSRQGS